MCYLIVKDFNKKGSIALELNDGNEVAGLLRGVNYVSLVEKLIAICDGMTDDMLEEIIDFVEYIKYRDEKEREKLVDSFINKKAEALKELEVAATSNSN